MLWYRNWLQQTTITFNLFKAYIHSVESPCTVDSTSSNLRLLPQLDIGIVSTLPHFLSIVLQVASTPWVLYLSGYHTFFNLFQVPPRILTCDIRSPREDTVWLVLPLGEHTSYQCLSGLSWLGFSLGYSLFSRPRGHHWHVSPSHIDTVIWCWHTNFLLSVHSNEQCHIFELCLLATLILYNTIVLPVQRLACDFFLLDRTLLDIFQDFLHSSPLAALLFSPHVADSQNFWRSCHNLEVKLGVQVCSNTSNQTLRLAILDNTDVLPCYRLSLTDHNFWGPPFIRSRYFDLINRLYVGCGNLELYLYALYMISDTCGPYFVLPPIILRGGHQAGIWSCWTCHRKIFTATSNLQMIWSKWTWTLGRIPALNLR
jgi:hypothetical protein